MASKVGYKGVDAGYITIHVSGTCVSDYGGNTRYSSDVHVDIFLSMMCFVGQLIDIDIEIDRTGMFYAPYMPLMTYTVVK